MNELLIENVVFGHLAAAGYPPDLSEDATQLVLRQAELSTEAGS